jgi:hypothetical protein
MELTLCNSIDVITNILDRGIYKSLFCMGRWMRISYFQVPPSVALEKSTKPKMTTNGMKSCNSLYREFSMGKIRYLLSHAECAPSMSIDAI